MKIITATTFVCSTLLAYSQNLVKNGTFDGTPSNTDWKLEYTVPNTTEIGNPGGCVWLNNTGGATDPSISQVLSRLEPGKTYKISGELKGGKHVHLHYKNVKANTFSIDIDGKSIKKMPLPDGLYSFGSFEATFIATDTSHTLRFRGEVDGSDGDVVLDNIVVVKVDESVSCNTKEFKIAEDKKIYEKINNNWVYAGDRAKSLFCEGNVLYCNSTDGTVWRYNNAPHSWTPGNTLDRTQELKTNQKLFSSNGEYYLVLQEDQNLCIYKKDNSFVWCAMTNGKGGTKLIMQGDGNLCMYTAQSAHVWSTDTYRGTADKVGTKLVLENDGSLVLYNSAGKAIWNNTNGRLY